MADKGHDADALRRQLRQPGAVPVIHGRSTRKRRIVFDKAPHRKRRRVENPSAGSRTSAALATRYDKVAANFLFTVALAVLIAFSIRSSLGAK